MDFRPDRTDFRSQGADFRPERAWRDGRTNKRTNKGTNEQKSPCALQDFVPFEAAVQKEIEERCVSGGLRKLRQMGTTVENRRKP